MQSYHETQHKAVISDALYLAPFTWEDNHEILAQLSWYRDGTVSILIWWEPYRYEHMRSRQCALAAGAGMQVNSSALE